MTRQTCLSARYSWDSARRGSDAYVILQWTLQGRGALVWDRQTHAIPAPNAFITIVPETLRYYYPAPARETWIFGWINFYGDYVIDLARKFRQRFGVVAPLPAGSPAALLVHRLAQQAEKRRAPDAYEVSRQIFDFWMTWWRQLDQPDPHPRPALPGLVAYCREHFRELISVKELAQRAGLSREHFTRVFQAHTQLPPATFLRRLRAEEAARLIRQTSWSLSEIAQRCGFRSPRQCREALQHYFQASPRRLRQTVPIIRSKA
jgi:AraC-like DNA-binding protein